MRSGKLSDIELNENVLSLLGKRRKEVLVGAGIGLDCAVLKIDGEIFITSDPITAKCREPGSLAIDINANDIYASLGEPIAAEIIILAPVSSNTSVIKSIMEDAERRASELNIDIVGGHTEFTDAVSREIVLVTMVGKKTKNSNFKKPKAGDSIIMTKYAAIETSLILAGIMAFDELNFLLTTEELNILGNLSEMLSIKKEAQILLNSEVGAVHDVTEGGIFGAVREMCRGGGFGCIIEENNIPVLPLTKKLCAKFNINPLKSVSSGSMILTASEPERIIKTFKRKGVPACVIGKITDNRKIIGAGGEEIIDSEKDEIYKIN